LANVGHAARTDITAEYEARYAGLQRVDKIVSSGVAQDQAQHGSDLAQFRA
jgi:hypothetical protein